jgi:septum site-determining protein MinC
VTIAVRPRSSIRFRGRSFMALVLAPVTPIRDWLAELDTLRSRSPGFFGGRAIIVDVSGLDLSKVELATLIDDLQSRDIRVMGIEGADPATLGPGLPPPVSGGKTINFVDVPGEAGRQPAPPPPPQPQVSSLMIEGSVRSGQSILHPEGDVTVLGSVASGAEIIAGGSIHVYGALRGRAIAGSTGHAKARIFCRKFEAELLAIDGLYKTVDDLEPRFRGQAVQVSLDGDAIIITALD